MEQGCPHRSILPHIFPDCNSFAIKIGGKFCGVRGVCPGGGLPRRCRRGRRQRYPAGGLPRRCRRGGRQRYPAGGLPRRCRRGGRQRYPAGGVPALLPVNPAFNLLPCPLSPPTPLPRWGRGRFFVFLCKGLRPLHPRAEPARHWFALPLWKTQWGGLAPALPVRRASAVPGGGLACFVACLPCHCGARGGACLLCRLPTLPLTCFPAPIPPAPFPAGKG